MQRKGHKSNFIFMLLPLFFTFQATTISGKLEQENVSIVAFLKKDENPITTIDIETYRKRSPIPMNSKEALKALLIRRIFLLAVLDSPFAKIHTARFKDIIEQEFSKVDLTGASPAVVKGVRKLIAKRVKEEIQIELFKQSLTKDIYITPDELFGFYKRESRNRKLPRIYRRVVIQQILYIPPQHNIEEALDFITKKIYLPLKNKTITFEQAEKIIKNKNANKGIFNRYYTTAQGNSHWLAEDIPASVIKKFPRRVKWWKAGDLSKPHVVEISSKKGIAKLKVIRIFYIKQVIKPHVITLEDYGMIMDLALQEKKKKKVDEWIKNQLKKYVTILDDAYLDLFSNL